MSTEHPISDPSPPRPPRILLAGFSPDSSAAIRAAVANRVGGAVETVALDAGEDGVEGQVLCLGPGILAPEARRILDRRVAEPAGRSLRSVVLGFGAETPRFYDLLAADRLFFLCPETPATEQIADLLVGAHRHHEIFGPFDRSRSLADLRRGNDGTADEETRERLLGDVFGHKSSDSLVGRSLRFVEETAEGDRADFFTYEPSGEAASSYRSDDPEPHSVAAGAVGFVLRTARSVLYDHASESPFFDPDLDAPPGDAEGTSRFLAVPLTADPAGRPPAFGAWVVWRSESTRPFDDGDRRRLEAAASSLAPVLLETLEREERRSLRRRSPAETGKGGKGLTFRSEALDFYQQGLPDHGQVLRISPEWTRYAYPLLLLLFAAAVIFSIFGRLNEYAEGVGLVRLEGRVDVTAPVAGTVSEVLVRPGEPVEEGRLLVKLYDVQEEAELQRIRREFELGLLDRLRRPADPSLARTLGTLRAQRQLAASRLEERSVRAPLGGTVSDLRVRQGRLLSPGEVVLSLERRDEDRRLLAVLPGRYRPQIHRGMAIRFEPEGFRYAYQHLEVDRVSDEVFGPTEARRVLGPGAGDALPVEGPVVLVEALLTSGTFESDGRTYELHDGSLGRVELRVRSEPILLTLVPGLKALWAPREEGR